MTAKEYLSQAKYLDMRINSKIQQLSSLNDLAKKCTSVVTGMPHSPSGSVSAMADTVNKIIDLQEEINNDIDTLVDLKRDIMELIKSVPDYEAQTILEKRYLCFLSWEQIAVDMHYSIQYAFRIHDKALEDLDAKLESKVDRS